MKIKHTIAVLSLICVAALAAIGQTTAPRRQFALYGINTLAAGQSLRLAVQNPRFSDSEIIPCVRVLVVFEIFEPNATDGRLRLLRTVSREVLLDGGEAVSLDFPSVRAERFVSASVFANCAEETACAGSVRIATTLSVRESGRAILTLPAVEKGFDPQPDPPAQIERLRQQDELLQKQLK